MEQLSRAAPFFLGACAEGSPVFLSERTFYWRHPLVDGLRRAPDLQTYHPLLGLPSLHILPSCDLFLSVIPGRWKCNRGGSEHAIAFIVN